jgi:hypothetical protein
MAAETAEGVVTETLDAPPLEVDDLVRRVQALERFLAAAEGHLPDARLAAAHTVVERAGQRLALSRHHSVVALAGATGSGKSSLFNALARMDLSPVGARRPTTNDTYACVWGSADDAAHLLDWLGILPRRRFARESELDGEAEAGLRGLVLLDLPDFDSIEASHRAEVDRILGLVDLVVWVLDPQKYADKVIHHSYLRQFHRHKEVTVVALNHADRLSPADVQRCLADLRRLLDADGLTGVPALASSAYGPPGCDELRGLLERAVATRQAALRRLAGDVDQVVAELSATVGPEVTERIIDDRAIRALDDALVAAAGVPAVVQMAEYAYLRRATEQLGWPVLRWLSRPRPRARADAGEEREAAPAAAARPAADPATGRLAAVGVAVRALAEQAADVLPAPWPDALRAAARSRLDDVPAALDRALARTDLGLSRTPWWWRLIAGVQWLALLAAGVGLVWLLADLGGRALGLSLPAYPGPGGMALPTLLAVGGMVLGPALTVATRPLAAVAARRARTRAESRLREAVAEVAREHAVAPVRAVLDAYGQARAALAVAGRPR